MSPQRPGTDHIETRLVVLAEMLEQTVAEVHRALAVLKGSGDPQETEPPQE